jgi:stress response protein YsnF
MTTLGDRLAIKWQLYLILLHRFIKNLVKPFKSGKQLNGKRLTMQNSDSSKISIEESSQQQMALNSPSIDNTLQEGQVLHIELYEEKTTIQSEVVVREKVQIRKLITQKTENS